MTSGEGPAAVEHIPSPQPVLNVVGARVALGPLRRDLVPLYHEWENDLPTSRNRGVNPVPRTLEQVAEGYGSTATDREVWFTVYECRGWTPIGVTWLSEVSYRDRTASFSIFLGTRNRAKGYGTEATRLMLDYAFTVLGMHNVMLIVAEFNTAGRRAYEKAGFRVFGARTQSYPVAGRLWNDVYMECLATEFQSPQLLQVYSPHHPKDP